MKEFEPRPYYRCDHCNKLYLIKKACENHEIRCKSNPKNYDKCLGCSFLEDHEEFYYIDYGPNHPESEHKTTGFTCTKLNKEMYPYSAKYKNLPIKYPESFEDKIQMPNECKYYKNPHFNIFNSK